MKWPLLSPTIVPDTIETLPTAVEMDLAYHYGEAKKITIIYVTMVTLQIEYSYLTIYCILSTAIPAYVVARICKTFIKNNVSLRAPLGYLSS